MNQVTLKDVVHSFHEVRGILRGVTALIDSDCVDILREAVAELSREIVALEDKES